MKPFSIKEAESKIQELEQQFAKMRLERDGLLEQNTILKKQIRRYESLTQIGWLVIDVDTLQVTWTNAALQIVGLSEHEAPTTTKELLTLVHPAERKTLLNVSREQIAKQGAAPIRRECMILSGPEKKERLCLISAEFCCVAQKGIPREVIISIQDISHVVINELEQTENRRLLEHIQKAIPAAIYLFDALTGKAIYTNRQLHETLGYGLDSGLETPPYLFSDKVLHPDDLTRVIEHRNQLKNARDGAVLTIEFRLKRPNGNWRWLQGRNTPFKKDGAGNTVQVIGSLMDISDLKETEEIAMAHLNELHVRKEKIEQQKNQLERINNELIATNDVLSTTNIKLSRLNFKQEHTLRVVKDNQKFISSLVDNLPLSVRVFNKNGQLVQVNQLLKTKFKLEDHEAQVGVACLSSPESLSPFSPKIPYHDVFTNFKAIFDFEYQYTKKLEDGTTMQFHLGETLFPITSRDNELTAVVSVINDLTEVKHAQISERQQKAFLKTLLETIPIPIFYKDINGKYVGCNTIFERFSGFKQHQIIGKTAFELYPKDLAVTYESAERKLIETGNNQKHEGQTIYADGSVRDVITYRTIYKDSNDNLGGTIGVLIDITDIKKSQKALNESRHQLLETQRIGKIGSWQWDSSANTIAISEVAASILGLKPEAQKIDADVFLAQLTSTDRTEFLYSLDEILGSGNMKTLNFEFELNTPTGIKRFCAIHAEPLSVQGKLQGSLQDISLQKETEMVLRESEGRYRNLVELAPLTIAVHTNGEITYINPAGIQLLHATSRADVIGRQISSIVHSLITDMPTTQADIYKELGNYPVHEEKLIRLDGTIIDVELVNMPIVYHGQHAVQVIAHDITERKKAEQLLIQSEQKLREINAAKDRFFSILAHDLRNPFNNIIGFTDLLKDGIDDFEDGEAAEILGLLNLTARNTYNLLENLLQWARTQTGKMEYMPQYVSVMTLFNETAGLFIVSSSNKGVLLEFGDSLDVEVVADPNMLKAILRNLVSNAIKFTPSGGKVTVSIEMIGNQVQFSIADTGVGITKADMEKLFRLDVSHTTLGTANEQGTGLGLVLCKEFVERNNGKIWIESVVGEGTVFYFTLPRGLAQ